MFYEEEIKKANELKEAKEEEAGVKITLFILAVLIILGFMVKNTIDNNEQNYASSKWAEIEKARTGDYLTTDTVEKFIKWFPESDHIQDAEKLLETMYAENIKKRTEIEERIARGFIKCKKPMTDTVPIDLAYEWVDLYWGPGEEYGRVENEKMLKKLNTLHYNRLDPSLTMVRGCEENGWTRVIVYKPAYLTKNYSGWVKSEKIRLI